MVHEEGMTLAAVAPTCGDLHRAHLEGLQQTLLRCLHFVSYSFSSKSLGATSAVNLSAAPFFLSHLQNSHESAVSIYYFMQNYPKSSLPIGTSKDKHDVSSLFGSYTRPDRSWLEWILQNQVSARRLELNKIIFRQTAPTLYDLVALRRMVTPKYGSKAYIEVSCFSRSFCKNLVQGANNVCLITVPQLPCKAYS